MTATADIQTRTGRVARVAGPSATSRTRTCCSSSTTSSGSPRPVPRSPPCSAACRRRWGTSRPWPTRWASCRSGSPRPVAGRSPRCRRSTCPRTTTPTRRPPPRSRTSTPPRSSPARSPRRGSTPAVDPLTSTSRILDPQYIGDDHFRVANEVKRILQKYNDLQDIIAILGIDELPEEDRQLVGRARRIERFPSQNLLSPSSSPPSRAPRCSPGRGGDSVVSTPRLCSPPPPGTRTGGATHLQQPL